MDDSDMEPDGEYCMVVEVQENEHGEIFIVEKGMTTEEVSEENIEIDGSIENNIEIVYLPNYDGTSSEQIIKRELVDDTEDIVRNHSQPFRIIKSEPHVNQPNKVYNNQIKRAQSNHEYKRSLLRKKDLGLPIPMGLYKNGIETQLRSNPNVILKHQSSIIHGQQGKSWSHKVDRRNFEPSAISSVTTIHTKPRPTVTDRTVSATELNIKQEQEADVALYPHKCEYCEQAFRGSTSLLIHSTTFHKVLPENCIVS